MINELHELTMTRVSECSPLETKDGFTVPFIKDNVKYLMHCYTSRNKLDLCLAAPKILMDPLMPWNFPVVGDALIVFGKTPNLNDGYALRARIIKSSFKYSDGSGRVDTSIPPNEFLLFTNMKMDKPTLKDDYVIVLNWLMMVADESYGAFFDRSGRPATIDLAYLSEDDNEETLVDEA